MSDDVECLVCGRRMQFLGTHIRRVHGMTAAEYRETFDLARSIPLASASFCENARLRMNERIQIGAVDYSHLPLAVEAARAAGRGHIATAVRSQRSETARATRPGDGARLPDGARRADGRDADRARETQRLRRSRKRDQLSVDNR